ncbi:phytoene desaturase family protein [Maribacter sp. HTCC2170]|uniref:phytoene desaturase family protein n=1 Tax=Maribacter sp. (strain HTCC2170 / KCCM 42371) TaxID=313603 RepID=UPI0002F00E00|nr:phytoene desaturase family protein [Maribacter sp. HTCC2170]
MNNKKIIIIGSGFSSLAASCYLAKAGFGVQIFEKNPEIGGRARQKKRDGFVFDIGPTFYWMPDVFESFFSDFDKKPSDYYQLKKLDPAYQVYFGVKDSIKVSGSIEETMNTFETIEPGSKKALRRFLSKAGKNYKIAIKDLVYKPAESILEIITPTTMLKITDFFRTIKKQVASYVKDEKLRKIMEFPVLFLGAKPGNTPSFYNFMNYADFELGTWHPMGGMYEVVEAMTNLALELGVEIVTDSPVQSIRTTDNNVEGIQVGDKFYSCDILLSGADYHHTESLLPVNRRQYKESYWSKKIFAPSALLFFVGFKKKLKNVSHHTLFFDTDFDAHAKTIYDTKEWSEDPLFYASFPSLTDNESAPEGKEAGIFLIPIAPDLEDNPTIREKYFNQIIQRMEDLTEQNLHAMVEFKESYCVNDFKSDYNSYKGNAYGLANTLTQTHILRPRLRSKKVDNLFFCGQLTVPGPGVPPSLISGKIVSELISKYY